MAAQHSLLGEFDQAQVILDLVCRTSMQINNLSPVISQSDAISGSSKCHQRFHLPND